MPMTLAFGRRHVLARAALAALWSGALLAAAPALGSPAPAAPAEAPDDPSRSPRDPAPPEIAAIGVPTGHMGFIGVFGGRSPLYFGVDDRARKGSVVDYTLLAIQPSPVRANGVDVVYAVTRHRMDCRKRTDTLLGGQAFDETGRVGAWLAASGAQDYSDEGEDARILAAICERGDPPVVVQGAAGALAHARANGHAKPPPGTHA